MPSYTRPDTLNAQRKIESQLKRLTACTLFCLTREDIEKFTEWCQYQLMCHLPHDESTEIGNKMEPDARLKDLVDGIRDDTASDLDAQHYHNN